MSYDVAIVGAGIVGLAHALMAARRGKRTVVIERDSRAVGASIRNFGFVTVTGQQYPECWRRARRSAEIWDEVAAAAGIDVLHRGLLVAARRREAMAVLEAFASGPMGDGCELLSPEAAAGGPLAKLRDGDIVRVDATNGRIEALVENFDSREAVVADLTGNGHGVGRELFEAFRQNVGLASNGAAVVV